MYFKNLLAFHFLIEKKSKANNDFFFSEKSSANFLLAFDAYALELQNILEERCEVSL